MRGRGRRRCGVSPLRSSLGGAVAGVPPRRPPLPGPPLPRASAPAPSRAGTPPAAALRGLPTRPSRWARCAWAERSRADRSGQCSTVTARPGAASLREPLGSAEAVTFHGEGRGRSQALGALSVPYAATAWPSRCSLGALRRALGRAGWPLAQRIVCGRVNAVPPGFPPGLPEASGRHHPCSLSTLAALLLEFCPGNWKNSTRSRSRFRHFFNLLTALNTVALSVTPNTSECPLCGWEPSRQLSDYLPWLSFVSLLRVTDIYIRFVIEACKHCSRCFTNTNLPTIPRGRCFSPFFLEERTDAQANLL